MGLTPMTQRPSERETPLRAPVHHGRDPRLHGRFFVPRPFSAVTLLQLREAAER